MEDCTTLPSRPSIRVNLLHAHGSPTGYLYNKRKCRCESCSTERVDHNRLYRAAHPEKRREYERLYREANSEKIAASGKRWYEANRERAAENNKRWEASNPGRRAATSKLWYEANRERHAANGRRVRLAKYNTSPEEWAALLTAQGNSCAVCGATKPGGNGTWHTDHDHDTGLTRGILCYSCNVGLGHFRDDPELLMAASEYLALER